MKRHQTAFYCFLFLLCATYAVQCKKVEEQAVTQRGGGGRPTAKDSSGSNPVTSDTSGKTGSAWTCNTFICLDLKDEIAQKWIAQPTNYYLSEGAAVAVGPQVYMGGGSEEGDYFGALDEVMVFNLETEQTIRILSLSLPRSHPAAAVAGTKVIFAGGKMENGYNRGNPDLYDVVDMFEHSTGARTVARLSQPRAHLASASAGSKAYFIGGLTWGSRSSARLDIFDAANGSWTIMDMPRARAYPGALVYNGKLYVAGGLDAANPNKPIYTVDVLDLVTGTWSALEAPHAHPHASVALADGKMFIAGGDGLSNRFVDIYDFSTGAWSSAELSDSRYDMAVAVMKDRVIFLGGNYSNAIDIYRIDQKTWGQGLVNQGVGGMMAAAWEQKALFTGFKFEKGNAVANVMWILRRI